jgi:C-terminal processing protease CtpA/Prc
LKGLEIANVRARQEHVGSGLAYDLDKETGALRIMDVYPNTPASRAGLSVGLIIHKINDVPTAGKSLKECVDLGAGGAGTKLRFEVFNPERAETNTFEITKEKFVTP